MSRYRTYAVTIDMTEATEGDFNDLRRALDCLEADYQGVYLLGSDETDGWPAYRIHEARKPTGEVANG